MESPKSCYKKTPCNFTTEITHRFQDLNNLKFISHILWCWVKLETIPAIFKRLLYLKNEKKKRLLIYAKPSQGRRMFESAFSVRPEDERKEPNSALMKNKWFTVIIRHPKNPGISQRSDSVTFRRVQGFYCCLCHSGCAGGCRGTGWGWTLTWDLSDPSPLLLLDWASTLQCY